MHTCQRIHARQAHRETVVSSGEIEVIVCSGTYEVQYDVSIP